MKAILLAPLLLCVLASLPSPAAAQDLEAPVCGDVNDSGSITTTDALLVLKGSVGQEVLLPCARYEAAMESCAGDLDTCNADLGVCDSDLSTAQDNVQTYSGLLANCQDALLESQAKPVCGDGVCAFAESFYSGKCNACLSDCGTCSEDVTRFVAHGTCGNGLSFYSEGVLSGSGIAPIDLANYFGGSCEDLKIGCMWVIPTCEWFD